MVNAWPPVHEPVVNSGRDLSIQEWLDLPEDSEGELIAGHLTEEEMPDAVHELAVGWLMWMLRQWLSGKGFVLGSDLKVVTGPDTGRKPDLTVFLPGGQTPPRRGPITQPPDIIVEVITPSPRDERRDRVEKMSEYARFGARYYWLIDPAIGAFEIFELTSQGLYQRAAGVTSGVIDPVPGCSGLRIDVDALWAELSRLADNE